MKKGKIKKLNKYERAILHLAKHIDHCPCEEHKVLRTTLDILGLEMMAIPPKK